MSFAADLKRLNSPSAGRRFLYVPYDQLSDQFGPLARETPEELAIVLLENPDKAARRPYHKQKLAWVLCQQRCFALEQAARGVAVVYRAGTGSYGDLLAPLLPPQGARVQRPAEWELRQELQPLVDSGQLKVLPHEGWLTTAEQFRDAGPKPPWRMDRFYRLVRRQTGILMEKGKPRGGRFSFDEQNRQPWKGKPAAPQAPTFPPSELKREVQELIETHFAHHPGVLDMSKIPVTQDEIEVYWSWVKRECLPLFGPFEDAMSSRAPEMFHSRLSPLINQHRLMPRRILDETLALDLPLASQEGFVRQLLGWREFVHHVHEATEGFRQEQPVAEVAGDGGWQTWTGQPWKLGSSPAPGGALPNALDAQVPLVPAFWGERSGLNCLDTVVAEVWKSGWSHHITRLMILSNLSTLLDCSPRELCDWFWVAYIDAYDWVVEPNVLAMGSFAVGDLMTTKPYVCGAAYINRMSDYCKLCRFDPASNCPVTALYWAFLARQRDRLERVGRVDPVLRGLARRSDEKKQADDATFRLCVERLSRGEELFPSETGQSGDLFGAQLSGLPPQG